MMKMESEIEEEEGERYIREDGHATASIRIGMYVHLKRRPLPTSLKPLKKLLISFAV